VLVEGDALLAHELRDKLTERGVRADSVDLPDAPERAAEVLYRRLRAADRSGAELLLVLAQDPAGIGRGVNDRLFRAAHGRVVLDANTETVDRLVASARG